MRENPGVGGQEPGADGEPRKKRLDLSVPQVAGSAVAAVIAAKLASYFGVYGTILGAGVVSVIATSGGTIFQHFFRRTGEQLREVTVQPKQRAKTPRPVRVPAGATAGVPGEFTEGTVYRAKVRSWKRPLIATALVFGVTMTGITTYELVSGRSFSGDGTSTTVGDAFKGHGSGSGSGGSGSGTTPSPSSVPESPRNPEPSTGDDGGASRAPGSGGGTTSRPMPDDGASSESGTGNETPAPAPSTTATTPAPSASSHSQSAGPDRADPATP
ncbi:hypothetical protein AB0912_04480 [Streptomyces sp. NPDC007084]|uniref:hypothetical protein n=1 Tax=Streptomyces sp. NPDC007084 TaxID=3154313 RepID=UPI0034528D7C